MIATFLSSLDCGALTGRPGTDHQKIIVERVFSHAVAPIAESALRLNNAINVQQHGDNSVNPAVGRA
jgi:hypothetical protein